eukprot:525730-Pleurochrysis_carterae.AAC.4
MLQRGSTSSLTSRTAKGDARTSSRFLMCSSCDFAWSKLIPALSSACAKQVQARCYGVTGWNAVQRVTVEKKEGVALTWPRDGKTATRRLKSVRPDLSTAGSDLNTYRVWHGNLVKLVVLRHLRI